MKIRHAESGVLDRPGNGSANVITRKIFDKKVMYVGRRIRTASIRAKTVGHSIPRLKDIGYLIVHGDKPGLLIREVKWDGKDVYCCNGKYGVLSALNSTKHKGYHAEIVSRTELIHRLGKFHRIVQCRLMDDSSRHTIALLNKNGDPYVAGVEMVNGKLTPRNLEPPRPYNKHAEGVRYTDYRDMKMSMARFLSGKRH